MKKIAVLMFVSVVFFANGSLIQGCESCEKLQNLGQHTGQVQGFITNGAADHEVRARQMLYLFQHKYSQRQVGIILGMSGVERRLRLIIPDSELTAYIQAPKPKQQVASIAAVKPQRQPQQIAKVETFRQQELARIVFTKPEAVSKETKSVEVKTEAQEAQILETTMDDAAVLMNPMEQQAQSAQEKAIMTNQQIKQADAKKQFRKQKYVDAGVTTSAVVSGLAITPPVGPIIAGGIILTRVGWGLFQKDPYDE